MWLFWGPPPKKRLYRFKPFYWRVQGFLGCCKWSFFLLLSTANFQHPTTNDGYDNHSCKCSLWFLISSILATKKQLITFNHIDHIGAYQLCFWPGFSNFNFRDTCGNPMPVPSIRHGKALAPSTRLDRLSASSGPGPTSTKAYSWKTFPPNLGPVSRLAEGANRDCHGCH